MLDQQADSGQHQAGEKQGAKQLAVIVGIPETMYKMVDNMREIQRYSSLSKRLVNLHDFMFGE